MNSLHSVILIISLVSFTACGGGSEDATSTVPSTDNNDPILQTTLDLTFGYDGVVRYDNAAGGEAGDEGQAVAFGMDGTILVTGSSYNGTDNDMVIWKYDTNGSLHPNFGNNGIVIANNAFGGDSNDYGDTIAIDSNGSIYVSGYAYNGTDNDMVLWKYDANGSVDMSFGINGIVTFDGGRGGDYAHDLVVDSNGSVFIGGSSYDLGGFKAIIWKYDSNGTLDTHFGNGNGYIKHGVNIIDSLTVSSTSLALDHNGSIILAGYSKNLSNYDLVVWKCHADGTLDTGFSDDGLVMYRPSLGVYESDPGAYVAIGNDNGIYIAGQSNGAMTIWKYQSNGAPDTAFGGSGIVTANVPGGSSARDIAIDQNGSIFITGRSGYAMMTLWKYHPDGTIDLNFNNEGVAIYTQSSLNFGAGVIVDTNDSIYVTGYSYDSIGIDMLLWKYNKE